MTTGIFTHLTRADSATHASTRRANQHLTGWHLSPIFALFRGTRRRAQIPRCNGDILPGFNLMIMTKVDFTPADNEKWQSIRDWLCFLIYLFVCFFRLPTKWPWNAMMSHRNKMWILFFSAVCLYVACEPAEVSPGFSAFLSKSKNQFVELTKDTRGCDYISVSFNFITIRGFFSLQFAALFFFLFRVFIVQEKKKSPCYVPLFTTVAFNVPIAAVVSGLIV